MRHEGEHISSTALHLGEPSPQRTPVLYQAGTSPAGRAFAGRHAECVFMSGPSKKVIAPRVAAIRKLAAEAGRDPASDLIFAHDDGRSSRRPTRRRRRSSPNTAAMLIPRAR